MTFEGAQGICPPGWHIPTRADFFNLCGLSNAAQGETGNQINEEALFYDSTYGGGKWTSYDEAGWNYVLTGARMKSSYTGTAKYQLTQLYIRRISEIKRRIWLHRECGRIRRCNRSGWGRIENICRVFRRTRRCDCAID